LFIINSAVISDFLVAVLFYNYKVHLHRPISLHCCQI